MKKDLSIYIHIPFCMSKCYYCDFNSQKLDSRLVEKYMSYLLKEIDLYKSKFRDYKLKTVFLGGGTPSLIDSYLLKNVLTRLYTTIDSSEIEEVTIEVNPKTVTLEKLEVYKAAKINRISIGLQTLSDDLLTKIGRTHNSNDFYDTYKKVRDAGFENISVDIMFNLPGQTKEDVLDTLKKVTKLHISHISFYSLKLEEGTKMSDMFERGEIELSDEDTEREMYHSAIEYLEKKGYDLYEISNFSKQGFESVHNLTYWKKKPYIGLGLSAHSNIDSYRYGNTSDFETYFNDLDSGNFPIDKDTVEFIDEEMEIAEYVMLGLRLKTGIDKISFKEHFHIDIRDAFKGKLDKLIDDGLIAEERDKIYLTDKGLDLSNLVFVEIFPD